MVCAASLAGCAGSSSSNFAPTTNTNSGAGQSSYSGYTGPGDTGAASASGAASATTSFAPTASAAAHSGAAQAAEKLTAVATPGTSVYEVGPLDVLDVSVFKVPDLHQEVQVSEEGTINYPLVGEFKVTGKTAHDIERELTQKLGARFLRSPQVTVLVKDSNSHRVTVEGSVKNSGVYTIKGRTTLIQVLAMSGGMNVDIASGDVVIFRTINGTRSAAKFDTDAIKAGKAEDPELQPGDVVVVDTSSTKVALQNVLKVLPLATTAAVFSGM